MARTQGKKIVIRGAREHNLKNIDLDLPRDALIVITGISGSGKSSLAFDTIYAEGQRRYVESLSAYARQFLEQMEKPDLDSIEGLSPAIAIEQKTATKNPRSTVGTVTEIYDYLRLLYTRVGQPHCVACARPIASQSAQEIVERLLALPAGTRCQIMAPIVRGRKGEYKKELDALARKGFVRARIDGTVHDLSEPIALPKTKKHTIEVVVDRLVVKQEATSRLTDSVETAMGLADGIVMVDVANGDELFFSEQFACVPCGRSFPELEPRLFSFNSPHGACPACDGLGVLREIDPELVVPDPSKSLAEGAVKAWERRHSAYFTSILKALAEQYGFSLTVPFRELDSSARHLVLHGSEGEPVRFSYRKGRQQVTFQRPFEGVVGYLTRRYKESDSAFVREEVGRYMSVRPCIACSGRRLRPEALAVAVGGLSIAEVAELSIARSKAFFDELTLPAHAEEVGRRILKEIRERLQFLINVGLDYLSLDRPSATLAGGEGQRIRLATQIGSSLVGVLYILDEPSIGLHQRDNRRLLDALVRLRDLGNTVVVVEHDRETILSGDYVVDLGPGAGVHGGHVVATGPPGAIMADKRSLTGRYLSGELSIPVPARRRRRGRAHLTVQRCRQHNLKEITVRIPLGLLTCITGVSGSGKSTLLLDIVYPALAQRLSRLGIRPGAFGAIRGVEHLDKVIDIDQSPIGRTPRSNPATYTGGFTLIRELFSQTPEARKRGYKPGRFSFNVKGGRCEACQGDGLIKIEMHFLPDLYVTCDQCRGRRFNRETLEATYKGRSIADVLAMTVDQALAFFEPIPKIRGKLETLAAVGLGYITLGQSATTLSGGEAQRVKLSKELSRRSTGKTLYILDEPTTGLHFADIQNLLDVLGRLADQGNTVVVIEHNLDVIKTADHIIDLGPEGGDEGGWIVAEGTPEALAEVEASYTGQALRAVLGLKKAG
ncbi:excinuclease ABC subunit UvrA [Nitrospinae bacterium AH_259_B05_G02_I21]|nr:excinuclease ABC subunit UvrA [Nitrospinae bacterium AH_259_B05_G02_I21]MDA2932490.1 excinuclease ABC subunit UvrA [Nitrospinae bacterium AH-259-F20]